MIFLLLGKRGKKTKIGFHRVSRKIYFGFGKKQFLFKVRLKKSTHVRTHVRNARAYVRAYACVRTVCVRTIRTVRTVCVLCVRMRTHVRTHMRTHVRTFFLNEL